MKYKSMQLVGCLFANRYILLALAVGIGLGLLLWWLLNEPIPQAIPERSLRI